MKILIYILMAIALALLVYNSTFLDRSAPFSGTSGTALIGVLAAACVLVILRILDISKKIQEKSRG